MAEHVCDPVHVAQVAAWAAKGWRPLAPGSTEAIKVAETFDPIRSGGDYYDVCQECGVVLNP